MWQTLGIVEERLSVKKTSTSWRVNGEYYRSPDECKYRPGSISYGLAWYQQGMKVREYYHWLFSLPDVVAGY
jgi:hypothetical protein